MEFIFENTGQISLTVKQLLKQNGVSKRMLAKLKHGQGQVLKKQKPRSLSFKVQPGETITFVLPKEAADPRIETSFEPISVVYEDQNWLLVNKPAGVSSVPGPTNQTDTMVNRVKGYLVSSQAENLVIHVVSRLDRFTSGLMLFAKHSFAQGMVDQLQLDKKYLAVISGHLKQDKGVIDLPLKQEEGAFRRVVDPTGQKAVTCYEVKERYHEASLVECTLKTGRTHQIRAHFAALNHPLVSDSLYGGPLEEVCPRQALHAYYLSFNDPFSKKQLTFNAELPDALEALLAKLAQKT